MGWCDASGTKMDEYIVKPQLGEDPGILGAIKLGIDALQGEK